MLPTVQSNFENGLFLITTKGLEVLEVWGTNEKFNL